MSIFPVDSVHSSGVGADLHHTPQEQGENKVPWNQKEKPLLSIPEEASQQVLVTPLQVISQQVSQDPKGGLLDSGNSGTSIHWGIIQQ